MNDIHTQGVVLRYTNTNESDRMLTVFSPELGRLSVLARGCRKPKSRFLSVSQLFCFSDFVLHRYRDIYILSQGEVSNAYYEIRNDVERLTYATYLLNITEEVVNPGEGNCRLFALLLHGLTYLSYSDIKPVDITLVYELRVMDLLGYRPSLSGCVVCGAAPEGVLRFSPSYGGILCRSCGLDHPSYPVHRGTIQTIRHVLDMDLTRMRVLKFLPEVREQLNRILPGYIEEKLEKRFKSRGFLESFFTSMPLTD